MNTFSMHTFGCRTNQAETETLCDALYKRGWTRIREGAPVSIIHTCTVTGRSDAKVRALVRQIARKNPQTQMVLIGCGVEVHRETFLKMDGVWKVLDNREKYTLPEILKEIETGETRQLKKDTAGRTRKTVKIQEGCGQHCAYCIVPAVRGPSRSEPYPKVLKEIKAHIKNGAREIVLTGTHVGQFAARGKDLCDLLREAGSLSGDFRLHLSSVEPGEVSAELIGLIASHPKICRHLHLSVQHLSDPVLARMNRPYGADFCEKLIRRIHRKNPNIRIGIDFIVGFPGETEKEFEEACQKIKKLPVHYGHVFRYSKRPGTPAADFPEQVLKTVSTERSRKLRGLLNENHIRFVRAQLKKPYTVLIEDSRKGTGFTENYLPVRILSENELCNNEFYTIKITELNNKEIITQLEKE